MKAIITTITILILSQTAFGQNWYNIDFDSPDSENNHIIIDTVSNLNNIWQIGVPDKPVFDSAFSLTHAIVTDTINHYPVNDTSSFFLRHIRQGDDGGNWSLQLNFWFKMDTDTLTDVGIVEASIDNGLNWVNLMTEDVTYELQWLEPKPVLSGNTNGWKHFSLELNMLTYTLGYSDTLLYRFTFISDSIETNKDGWMIDDFQLADIWEGIEEISNNDMIRIYPNPSNGELSIVNKNDEFIRDYRIEISDLSGKVIYGKEVNSNKINLDLPGGFYLMKIMERENIYMKKFIIE